MLRMEEVPTPEVEPSAGGTSEATNSPAMGEGGLQHGQVQPSSGRSSPLSHIEHLGEGAQRLHGQVQPSSGTSRPLSHMKHLGGGAHARQHGLVQVPRRHAQEESEGEVFDKNNHQMTTYNTNDNTDLRALLAHNILSLNAEYGDGWELPSENLGALLSPPWECMETAARVGVHAGAASRAAPEPTPADGLPADDLPAGTALEPTPAGTLSADDLLPTAVASVASESDRLLPTARVFPRPGGRQHHWPRGWIRPDR